MIRGNHRTTSQSASRVLLLLITASFTTDGIAAEKRVAALPPAHLAAFDHGEKAAVIVGIGEYPSLPKLRYAAADAKAVADVLRSNGYKVQLLVDGQATRGSIVDALERAEAVVDREDGTLLFYFSGHGFSPQDQDVNYLATIETYPKSLKTTALPLDEVIKTMERSPAKRRVLLLDACRNPAQSAEKAIPGRAFAEMSQAAGTAILFSTRLRDYSYEDEKLGHGVFSNFVVKGLEGAAAKDDGLVTFADLSQYVESEVKNHALAQGWTQIPYKRGEWTGEFLLARAPVREASVPNAVGVPSFGVGSEVQPKPSLSPEDLREVESLTRGGYAEAAGQYRNAVERNDADEMNNLGFKYARGEGAPRDGAKAQLWLGRAADRGSTAAMVNLGWMLEYGEGTAKNEVKALDWYRKAAMRDNVTGMANFATMLYYGRGTKKDWKEAAYWFTKAAEAGHPKAMNNLGMMYMTGHGVPKNKKLGIEWYKKAARAGHEIAKKNLRELGETW